MLKQGIGGQAAALHQRFTSRANPTAKGSSTKVGLRPGRIPKLMPRRAELAKRILKKEQLTQHRQSC